MPLEEPTPRSSITFIERHSFDELRSTWSPTVHSPLDAEILRDEENFERYGGDDIHEPPPKTPKFPSRSNVPSPSAATTLDSDMITWDGPDDPENPQNWSTRYKWMVTIVCVIMSVNVFVDFTSIEEPFTEF